MGNVIPPLRSHRGLIRRKAVAFKHFAVIGVIGTVAVASVACSAVGVAHAAPTGGSSDWPAGSPSEWLNGLLSDLPSGSSSGSSTGHGQSVLATDGQRKLEALARQILGTEVVRDQITQVQALYAADPRGSTPAGKATIDRAANSIAAAAVQYGLSENPDDPVLMWAITAPHEFSGLSMPRSGYGIENPDNVYRQATVAGDASYEIRGKITAPGPVELHFELRDAVPGTTVLNNEAGKTIGALSSDQITVGADGSFVVTVDSKPADGRRNHLPIPAETTSFLVVRDLLNDWSRENPVQLDITRVSGPPIAAPKSVDQLAERSAEILSKMAPFWLSYFNQYLYAAAPANVFSPVRARPGGRGLSTNGWFDLADDQALVATVDPVGAKSLGIQITDPWGVAYEYRDHTSSLNTTQSKPNPDGTYTFVISKNDPGVFNWLDPEGHGSGMLAVRWQAMTGTPTLESAVREVKVVKADQLRQALSPATIFVNPGERAAQQRERAANFDRRMTG